MITPEQYDIMVEFLEWYRGFDEGYFDLMHTDEVVEMYLDHIGEE